MTNIPPQNSNSNKNSQSPSPTPPPKKEDDRFDNLYSYAKSNPRDLIAYVLLILGILLLFFEPIYGGLLVGLVVGIYFSKEIIYLIKHLDEFIDKQGLVRSLILGGLALALFISAPAIFIGAALIVCLKIFLLSEET